MVKVTRTLQCLILVISLLITTQALGFFSKPHWLHLPGDHASFWSQMSRDFAIDCNEDNPAVQRHIQWFLQHPKHLNNILRNSQPFMNYVYQQTQQRNLPAELALIPILESQYNPTSGSRSGPAGLWQMMPGTAVKYGVKINRSYDGRKDVSASTKAALNYLAYLYHYFHEDWLLALAAYQTGEGKIKYLADSRTNFWHLSLAHKTNVPKLLAIAAIIKRPGIYNIHLPRFSREESEQQLTWNEAKNDPDEAKEQFTDRADLPAPTATVPKEDINLAAAANRSDEEHVALPKPSSKKEKSHASHKKYTIKKGDTLTSIAKKLGVSATKLKSANHLANPKHLKVGKKLIIPHS